MTILRALLGATLAAAVFLEVPARAQAPKIAPKIMLKQGMILTAARQGDYIGKKAVDTEIITTVSELNAEQLSVATAFAYRKPGASGEALASTLRTYVTQQVDLKGGHKIHDQFCDGEDATLPGVTGWPLASSAIVQDLVGAGVTRLSIVGCNNALIGGLTHQLYRGALSLVTKSTESFPLILNGTRVEVPVHHIKGPLSLLGNEVAIDELWILADPESPIVLRAFWSSKDPDDIAKHTDTAAIQIVRIDVPEANQQQTVSDQLAGKTCRAELHGVYFNTDSAGLLSASDGTLRDVAGVLKTHPDWNLTIEGHTDNTGTPEHNLDLSNRRAAAVKEALVSRFGVTAPRLATSGLGQTHPVEDNSTIPGRARNRRVELSRKCN